MTPHYRTVRTPQGEISFSTYFWSIHASGNIVTLSPKRCLPKESCESVCKKTLSQLRLVHRLTTIDRQGVKPKILLYQAAVIPLPVADEKII